MIPHGVESVNVPGPLGVRVGEYGGKSTQDVAKQDNAPQHEHCRHPLLFRRGWENISIAGGGREEGREGGRKKGREGEEGGRGRREGEEGERGEEKKRGSRRVKEEGCQ